eukprot:1177151-Prorocentrum_minimum.AAC.1
MVTHDQVLLDSVAVLGLLNPGGGRGPTRDELAALGERLQRVGDVLEGGIGAAHGGDLAHCARPSHPQHPYPPLQHRLTRTRLARGLRASVDEGQHRLRCHRRRTLEIPPGNEHARLERAEERS